MHLLPLTVSATAVVSAASSPHAKRAAIDECLKNAKVPVTARNSTEWKTDASPFNDRLPYTPAAIAKPATVEHIQAAVLCAAEVGVKANPKSGGHSYASFGLGGEDGHLVVELDRMYNVTLDPETHIATVQPGARLGHIATVLYEEGKRAFSHGTCPGVGVGGHSLHGGFGFSSHSHGLAVDWITSADVVLANGSLVTASETENPDLFWALRGAGSNFGIVASFRFKTFAAPPNVTSYEINLPWTNSSNVVKGWGALQEWLLNGGMPEEMNMRVLGNAFQTQLQGLYHGNASALKTAIQPLLALLDANLSSVQEHDWMEGFRHYAYSGEIDITDPGYDQSETFYSKSLVTSALPPDVLERVAEYWIETANKVRRSWYIIIDMYGGPNSAVTRVPPGAGSYAFRDPERHLFLYELYDRSFGPYPDDGFAFLDGWVHAFTGGLDSSDWGMYINYADPGLDRAEAQEVYYRQNLDRLRRIKQQLDPTELFYYPQAVEPAEV
ncbi:FAD linked oxidase-like protein [Thermothelomyces thermophilus ATCC 42464]|uniref:Xylooligosaccharide oxidase n=2 Tax=Thermothelomyces thermophilus TaxID=78579 RepID=XYLO_THET4|nr:FAD linked oxidase-like protein [Thermothelomyces thermophilus ATCC 42464]G2QG48.1 RecName: Full=Xylooligosaccharide oxidase; Short=XOS; Flags: Precursor [Thermothelomyces thermophilus ATCC 42464]5K8E_A Chain A, FAD linked oxidase-like protein [Thermothelomyces thermophilus ATCC 42464]5L6F_A Chain A, FAD linked oxidase-like protein [Thermothelomyces thermophilus ATCC 42464]5L6G_A Chain A, FAD linked oxidase-like protein [Thermothelomyces thermophilus ATCC 42464]ANF89368.1 xylooligosaccharid